MVKVSTIANGIFVLSGILVIFYNEHFEFHAHHREQWERSLQSLPAKSNRVVWIMFVVDPHLQDPYSLSALFRPFLRWDADRYVMKYIGLASSAVDPDVIIFMGDLLDRRRKSPGGEGSPNYSEQFRSKFNIPKKVMSIFVASNNDLRDSKDEDVNPDRLGEFESHFSPVNEVLQYKHIRFYKMDFLPFLHAVPEPKLDTSLQKLLTKFNSKPEHGEIRVLLSHHTISDTMLHRHITIMQTLHPSYAFSAHTHYSGFVVHDLQKLMSFFNKVMPGPNNIKDLQDPRGNIRMDEYKVPTCNYLTGVPSTAFAVAAIDSDGELHYALLWLPSRFSQLRFYCFYIIAVGLFMLWKWCRKKRQYR